MQVREIMYEMDEDGSGNVTFSEFAGWWRSYFPPEADVEFIHTEAEFDQVRAPGASAPHFAGWLFASWLAPHGALLLATPGKSETGGSSARRECAADAGVPAASETRGRRTMRR